MKKNTTFRSVDFADWFGVTRYSKFATKSNKLVCKNAGTKVHRTDRSYSLRVVSSCSQSVCINSLVSGKGAFFISFFQTISVHPIISANLVCVTSS